MEEEKDISAMPVYEEIKSQKEINLQMRSILVDWIIDVHYKFGFTDETLFMSILIIDRYISIRHISRIRFQLLGITAMMLACKHEEINIPKVEDFIYITDNAYTKTEVIDMENDILNAFNYELLYPSPIKFFEILSLKFNFNKLQYLMGKYLMESFLVDLKWINYKPSVISCACIYIVLKFYKMPNYQDAYNKKYFNLNENDFLCPKFSNEYDIKECAKHICSFVDNINKTNYLSCKKKYATKENEKISLIVEGQEN
jgi:cyclin B